ncbi:enhancer of mRNA-decapping protein 4 homolog isoform X2 [Malaya genurostris]|nr:enhancer of mRNA-decapping protein 4 homolog isoform X2 [Malaya genurostris]XP_058447811.1 enhancer of mRNA-decapping protein 4 homolog isoform X2 [Malaya genurostris]
MEKMGKSTTTTTESATSSTVVFNKDDKQHCFDINGRSVTVIGNVGKHDHGSSKVKLKNIVDYKWEQRNYPGRLIACHNEGKLIAYAITVNHRATPEGMVRIVHLLLGQRALIKGMSGEVLDLQFAHSASKILLGVIEQIALHVSHVEIVNDKIICTKLLKVNDPIDGHVPLCDKISWCPYLQDNDYEDLYASQLLVWTRGDIFQCYSISTVVQHYGSGEISGKDISEGGFKFGDTLPIITGAIFSADGTTLAISCDDGVIRFYQVYQHTNDSNPRCLHQWKPHGGKTISSFFFLDNYTEQAGDQSLWQHAITCSDNNTEIKVWSCETWECTQMIKFALPIEQPLHFKAEIDATSSFLVLSDMATRELYVLQVRKETCPAITNGKSCEEGYSSSTLTDSKANDQNNTAASTTSSVTTSAGAITRAFISSIAEFPLSSPILSFGILDVAVRMFKTNDAYLIDELDDYDEENSALYCVVIRMYLVQPKSVQECHLFYQPNVTFGTVVRSTISSISSEYRNISQSSNSTNKDERGNSVSSLMDMINKNASNTAILAEGTDSSLNTSDKVTNAQSKDTEEIKKIISPIASSTALSTSTDKVIQQKQAVNLMTPDSFNSTSDKTDTHKTDETVNPDVLNTLLMLANVTKQQQQMNSSSITSPNESLKEKPSPLNMLNIVNSTMIEEQEQAKVRQSVELQQKVLLETPPVPPMPSTEMLASGGSSPSREVQEILSLKDNDCLNEYYDSDNILLDETDGIGADDDELNDLENEIIDDEEDDDGYNFKNIDDDDDDDELQRRVQQTQEPVQKRSEVKPINQDQLPHGFVKSEPVHDKVNKNESSRSGGWPKVPEVPHPPQNNSTTTAQQPPPQPPMVVTTPQNSKQLDDLTQKMDLLLDIVQTQSRQITDLRSQVHDLHKTRSEEAQRFSSAIHKLEMSIFKKMDDCFARYDRQQSGKVEACVVYQNRQLRDGLIQALPQIMNTHMIERFTATIIAEIQRFVIPHINAKVDQMTHIIKMDITTRFNNFDALFRSNLEKMIRSQPFIDTLSATIQAGVRNGLERVYHESVRNVILPGYEKSSQELFRQLNTAFSAGTKEYIQKMDKYLEQNKQVTDRTAELIELVRKVPEHVNTDSERQFKTNTVVLREDITRDFKLLQTSLLKVIRENIRYEIEKGLEAQASSLEDSVLSAVRSQAQTPAPSNVDIQEQIRQLLANGQINKAFHKALLSNDLSLVDYTLEKADYKHVFSPCPLEQTVLLSLIQQISADMANHNELKHRYLSDSIVSLNFMDPITKEHAPKVMRELNQNCQTYLTANPGNPLATSMKMLLIAIQGLGFKQF